MAKVMGDFDEPPAEPLDVSPLEAPAPFERAPTPKWLVDDPVDHGPGLTDLTRGVNPLPAGGHEARELFESALEAITGPRNARYGHPADDFAALALMLRGYVRARFGIDLDIQARDVPNLMILLKVAREAHVPKKDNLRDIVGYAGTSVMEHVARTGQDLAE